MSGRFTDDVKRGYCAIFYTCTLFFHSQEYNRPLQPREIRLRSRSNRFIQSLDSDAFSKLSSLAQERGITTQELIRAVIIPEWMETESSDPGPYLSRPRPICRFRTYRTRVTSRSALVPSRGRLRS